MDGALRGYALLPREITTTHQLVLNDVGDEVFFRSKVRAMGLDDSDVIIFKRRTDEELEALYNLCKVFMFPSRYEGFGLPILEAMTCGAVVIAADNSSLPEVVGRSDALFDSSSDKSLAALLHKALTDDAFRADLAAYGPRRAEQFNWRASAQRAWDAFRDRQHRGHRRQFAITQAQPSARRLRVAHVSPLPPQKSGIAMYCAGLLPYLAEHFDIDLFTRPDLAVSDPNLTGKFSIFPWSDLPARRDDYDAVIYHMGNSELHIPMLELIAEIPGVVVSHDFFLSNLPFVTEVRTGKRGAFRKEMDHSHGLPGVLDYLKDGAMASRWNWPINWRILRGAQELVVHSEHQNELIRLFYGHGWRPRTTIIKTYRESAPEIPDSQRLALRQELGLPPDAFIFCSFGFMAETKLNNLVIQAFANALPKFTRPAQLVFVGELEGGEYGQETLRLLRDLKLEKRVRVTGYGSEEQYQKYLGCAEAAIQLRGDSRGETSSALLDCLAHGIATVINPHGSFKDYGPDVVVRLSENPALEELTAALVRLQTDDDFRLEKGQRAHNLIVEQHDPRDAAAAYARVISSAARTRERVIFSSLLDSIARAGYPATLVQSSSRLAAAHMALRCQPRLLVDVSGLDSAELAQADRTAAHAAIRELFAVADRAVHLELVHAPQGSLVRASRTVETVLRKPKFSLGMEVAITIQPGDVLLVLDSLLPTTALPVATFQDTREVGGKIVTIAMARPERLSLPPALESDFLICGSRRAAEQVYAGTWDPNPAPGHPRDILFPADDGAGFLKLDAEGSDHRASMEVTGQGANGDNEKGGAPSWISRLVQEGGILNALPACADGPVNGDGIAVSRIEAAPPDVPPAPLRSVACSQAALESQVFQDWVGRFKGRRWRMHRKLWEWAYISQALFERGFLKPGNRGLVFAVGQEPLPALFASFGCEILATDLRTEDAVGKSWLETDQHSSGLADLVKPEILPESDFRRLVSFRFVDMTRIDADLQGFDFVWSSCSLEHLGTLDRGREFIFNSLKCLRPGGLAVHTTEFNLSSNDDTKEEGQDVIYRRRDLEEIGRALQEQGHSIDLDFTRGDGPFDRHVDRGPFKLDVHLRLEIWGYVCTSFGLIIQKAP